MARTISTLLIFASVREGAEDLSTYKWNLLNVVLPNVNNDYDFDLEVIHLESHLYSKSNLEKV